jgi:hypothetical protein
VAFYSLLLNEEDQVKLGLLDDISAFEQVEIEVGIDADDGNSADVINVGNAINVGNDGNDALDFKDDLGASGSPRDIEWNLVADEVDADLPALNLKFIKGNYFPPEKGKLL